MQKPNCKCLACGKEYYFCLKCNQHSTSPAPMWKVDYCCENCKTIFETVSSYNCGSMTKDEAKEILGKCDLAVTLRPTIKEVVDAIMGKSTKSSKEEPRKGLVDADTSKGLMAPSEEEKGTE